MKSGILLILVSAIFLYGCAQPESNYFFQTKAIEIIPHQQSEQQSKIPANLDIFKEPVNLEQAIEIALANNPEVAAMEWDTVAAQAKEEQIFAERLPRLGLAGGYNHHLDEQRLLPVAQPGDPAILSRDIFSGDIIMSLPIFTGGRLINQVKAADLLQQAAAHKLARSKEELVYNVSSVFFSILAQRQVIESLEFSRQVLQEHLKRVDALVAAQKAAEVDRLRTNVRIADIEQKLVREENIQAIQYRVLANLLGIDNHTNKMSLYGELELSDKIIVPEFEETLAKAWTGRDDYLAVRSALEAQARNVDAVRAEHWPTVLIQGSYGGRWAAGSTTGTGDEFGDVGRVGLTLEIPIYDGGRINAKIQEQRAGLVAARERFNKLELQIRLEVETALLNIQSSRERIEAIQKAVEQAKESLRIEREKYELGKGAIVDVFDAQDALLESQTNYFRALADYNAAIAQLNLAVGEEK